MDHRPYEIGEFSENDLEDLNEHLERLLPFTVNMLATVRDHLQRCRILVARKQKSIAGALVEFSSTYNRHIWNDPIIWITGPAEVEFSLFRERGRKPAIIITQADFARQLSSRMPEIRVFEEYIMVAGLDHLPKLEQATGEMKRLTTDESMDSLLISGYKMEDVDEPTMKREENFLEERVCMGFYVHGNMVSRGAIMSITDKYASIGGFLTAENARKKGYGSRIVAQTMRRASVYSENACLFVKATNENAISVYKKLGFKIKEKVFFTDLGTGSIP